MVDYVRRMSAKKSIKYSKYRSFGHLRFFLSKDIDFHQHETLYYRHTSFKVLEGIMLHIDNLLGVNYIH